MSFTGGKGAGLGRSGAEVENWEKRGIKSLPGSVQNPGLLWRQMGERSCLCETNIWWGPGWGVVGAFPI